MSIISAGQSLPTAGSQNQPSSDGEIPVHGLFSEDLRNIPGGGIICGQCAGWARGSYERYLQIIAAYHHGLDLSDQKLEGEFNIWFSGQPIETEHAAEESIQKLQRLNLAKLLFASMRQKP